MSRFLFSIVLFTLVLQVCLQVLKATPTSQRHRRELNLGNFNGNSISETSTPAPTRAKQLCYETIPCGWAHYTTNSNRFRPIYHYTKNNLCSCMSGHHCVLTDNRLDRKAYIFRCRNIESSSHMYQFPH